MSNMRILNKMLPEMTWFKVSSNLIENKDSIVNLNNLQISSYFKKRSY